MFPWVSFLWLWVDFLGYLWSDFGGCGGGRSRPWVVVVMVVGYVKWWLTDGGGLYVLYLFMYRP